MVNQARKQYVMVFKIFIIVTLYPAGTVLSSVQFWGQGVQLLHMLFCNLLLDSSTSLCEHSFAFPVEQSQSAQSFYFSKSSFWHISKTPYYIYRLASLISFGPPINSESGPFIIYIVSCQQSNVNNKIPKTIKNIRKKSGSIVHLAIQQFTKNHAPRVYDTNEKTISILD